MLLPLGRGGREGLGWPLLLALKDIVRECEVCHGQWRPGTDMGDYMFDRRRKTAKQASFHATPAPTCDVRAWAKTRGCLSHIWRPCVSRSLRG